MDTKKWFKVARDDGAKSSNSMSKKKEWKTKETNLVQYTFLLLRNQVVLIVKWKLVQESKRFDFWGPVWLPWQYVRLFWRNKCSLVWDSSCCSDIPKIFTSTISLSLLLLLHEKTLSVRNCPFVPLIENSRDNENLNKAGEEEKL